MTSGPRKGSGRGTGNSRSARRALRWRTTLIAVIALLGAQFLGASGHVSTAFAANTVIGFDDIIPGAQIDIEYSHLGVIFGSGPHGQQGGVLRIEDAGSAAHSGTQVATTNAHVEQCRQDIWARFTTTRQYVGMYVGILNDVNRYSLTLSAYDVNGKFIRDYTTSVPGRTGVNTLMSITSASEDIAFVHLDFTNLIPNCDGIAIDDFSFDIPSTPPPPDFSISYDATRIGVPRGHDADGQITIQRFNGSQGRIQFLINRLPQGVDLTELDPNPNSFPEPTGTVFRLHAQDNAPLGTDIPITIMATPLDSSAGTTVHSITVLVTVQQYYQLEISGLEVTQGTQYSDLPQRDPAHPSQFVLYRGVHLVSGKKTVVRLFASAAHAPPAGIAGVEALLYAYDNHGRPLDGSPLSAEFSPSVFWQPCRLSGVAVVCDAQRNDPKGAFLFTLPSSWTGMPINLEAKLLPPAGPLGQLPEFTPCPTTICPDRTTFDLDGISFTPMGAYVLTPLQMVSNGVFPDSNPWNVTEKAREVSPEDVILTDYAGTIDISDLAGEARANQNADALDRVEDWDEDNQPADGDFIMGISSTDLGMERNPLFSSRKPYAVVRDQGRPLSSVAHEMFHGYTLKHADHACGGDSSDAGGSDPWPDPLGLLEGVGLDLSSGPPYAVIQPHPGRDPMQTSGVYDFMSYCYADENGIWVSPRNWDNVVDYYHLPSSSARPAARPANPTKPGLLILAYIGPTGAHISVVDSHPYQFFEVPPPSPYHLVGRDAGGHVLFSVPMQTGTSHVGGQALTLLRATVPAAGVQSIAITHNGVRLAGRTRSSQVPTVSLSGLLIGTVLGGAGTSTTVHWKVSNGHGAALTAAVDYSADNGTTWRTVYMGPDRGSATIPGAYLTGSNAARLRVRINDGFNVSTALSPMLRARGSPPTVHIEAPSGGERISSEASLYMTGSAVDDARHPITGVNLQWYLGNHLVGTGQSVSATNLPAGRQTVRLVARDSLGRTADASVLVTVAGAKPFFLVLQIPDKIRFGASLMAIQVASNTPATLIANGQTYAVNRATRRMNVGIDPCDAPVELDLSLSANGTTISKQIEVNRTGTAKGCS